MRFVLFCHSLVSDWNHGNAHFLRGVVRELKRRGHAVTVYEPRGGWSRTRLSRELGRDPAVEFQAAFPGLNSIEYEVYALDLDEALDDADVVIVHEWTDPVFVARIGRHRRQTGRYRLLFHDTHHRSVSARDDIARLDLDGYDGVLAFGEAIREIYLRHGWSQRAWTWHEAADTTLFRPIPSSARDGHLVWIGNWGDDERSAELHEFLLDPARALGLRPVVHGVRYPASGLRALRAAGAEYRGYLPNHRVPETFARFHVTVHVPRRQYVTALPGIPTIRMFEALACGIPLIAASWRDTEGLFGRHDFLVARNGIEMMRHLRALFADADLRASLAANGLARIRARHTCAHRIDALLEICADLGAAAAHAAPDRQPLAVEAT
ncbi:MAG TPA: glycosyltransferase [Alphaproteobacteria bacterium]